MWAKIISVLVVEVIGIFLIWVDEKQPGGSMWSSGPGTMGILGLFIMFSGVIVAIVFFILYLINHIHISYG